MARIIDADVIRDGGSLWLLLEPEGDRPDCLWIKVNRSEEPYNSQQGPYVMLYADHSKFGYQPDESHPVASNQLKFWLDLILAADTSGLDKHGRWAYPMFVEGLRGLMAFSGEPTDQTAP